MGCCLHPSKSLYRLSQEKNIGGGGAKKKKKKEKIFTECLLNTHDERGVKKNICKKTVISDKSSEKCHPLDF